MVLVETQYVKGFVLQNLMYILEVRQIVCTADCQKISIIWAKLFLCKLSNWFSSLNTQLQHRSRKESAKNVIYQLL
jgi:hypothetical protein